MATKKLPGAGRQQRDLSLKAKGRTDVSDTELVRDACDLRRKHATYREIAERLKIPHSTAHDLVQRGLRDLNPIEGREQLRTLEAERLENWSARLFPRALNGDDQAGLAWLKARESYRRLYGLDAPTQVQMQATVVEVRAEVVALLQAISTDPVLGLTDPQRERILVLIGLTG